MSIVTYDLLFHKDFSSFGTAEKYLYLRKAALESALAKILVKNKVKEVEDLLAQYETPDVQKPRYVRVNTLKLDVDSAVTELGKHCTVSMQGSFHPSIFISFVWVGAASHRQFSKVEVKKDDLIPDLLILPPGTDLHDHPLVTSGNVFLQGKASSMVAVALGPRPGWQVLDACSAPGNKTVHLAALMKGKGKIVACELNKDRVKLLQNTIQVAGANNVEVQHGDFLKINPDDPAYSELRAILLDPSCSGSGTTADRLDHLLPSHMNKDGQPPTKRLRLSCAGSSNFSSGLRAEEQPAAARSLKDLMARPIQCQGEEEAIGSRGVIKKLEFVRLITGALYALGYERSGACLEEESGIPLQTAAVNLLMQHVLDGRWDESALILQSIGVEDETIVKTAKFLILEQKFFELLDDGKTMDALNTLRTEISPLHIKTSRVHELSSCILYHPQSQNGFARRDSMKGKLRSEVLDELQKLLPPTIMVPAKRLEYLVEQALNLQRGACMFHNSADWEMSLYTDHHCGRDNIPSRTLQILEGHQDEVWYLQFSHNGKYLASACNDGSAIIWEVCVNGEVALKHRLCGHQKPVSQVAWSPDDQQLLTCGTEETVRRWDVLSAECLQVYEKAGVPVVSCAWSPDGESVFAGFSDKSIGMWDLNGKELHCWKGQRTLKISDLEITLDGKQIISICKETAISLLDRETKVENLVEEDQAITSFSLSNDGKFLLLNLANQEIHLWTIDGDIKLVAQYKGHKRSRFVVRSCFGGLEQSFIASGSEDSQVYIWHRSSGQLVDILPGHSGVVNCVSWNPVDHHMLATASDDRTIRIWGLNGANMRRRVCQSNGSHNCNGKS